MKSVGKTWDEIKTLSTNPSDTQSKLDSIVDLNVSERIDLKEWEELVDEVHEMEKSISITTLGRNTKMMLKYPTLATRLGVLTSKT